MAITAATLSSLATIGTIVGAGLSATAAIGGATAGVIGAVETQKQMEANAQAQQDMADYNAKIEQNEANAALQESQAADQRQRQEQARFRAQQRAAYGKSGAALAAGSPLAVLGQTAGIQQMESNDVLREGATAYGQHQQQRQGLLYQKQVARKSVSKGGMWAQVGGSIAQGVGGVGQSLIQGAGIGKK